MIYTKEQVLNREKKTYLKMLVNGTFGAGKTYFSMTFPKYAYAQVEPNGILTAQTNPGLLENMVYTESFVPGEDEDIKDTFQRFHAFLKKVKEDAKNGIVETLILDNLTHFSHNRWLFIEKYEATLGRSGKPDVLGMFGALSRYMYKTILTEVIALPCHVVITVHEMEEEEEQAMKDGSSKRVKTGNVISNTLGGFRNDAGGLVNAVLYLEAYRNSAGQRKFRARCIEGNGKLAKNNLGLPEFVDNISYQSIMETIDKSKEVKQ